MDIIDLAEARRKLEEQKEDEDFSCMTKDEQIDVTLQNITDVLILFSEKIEELAKVQNQTSGLLAEISEGVLDTAKSNIKTGERLNEFAESAQQAFNKASEKNSEIVEAFNTLSEDYNKNMPLVMEKIIDLYKHINE